MARPKIEELLGKRVLLMGYDEGSPYEGRVHELACKGKYVRIDKNWSITKNVLAHVITILPELNEETA